MTDDQPPTLRPTAEPITAVVADRVRALRTRAGMSQADLAEAMAARGIPWKRATVVNLEKRGAATRGKVAGRDAVTVQELLTLALVLHVSPALLLADPRSAATVPVASEPQRLDLDAWTALFWFAGLATPDEHVGAATYRFALDVINDGFALVERINFLMPYLGDGLALPEMDDVREPMVRRYLESIAQILKSIERQGVRPPAVPERVIRAARQLEIDLPGREA